MADSTGKKVGYLKGLLEGMDFGDKEARKKLITGIVDVLGDLSDRADSMTDLIVDLNDYVESIDDDLTQLEDGDFAMRFDEDDEDEDEDFSFNEGERQLRLLDDDEEDDEDDDESDFASGEDDETFFDVGVCPSCKGVFMVELDLFSDGENERFVCPHCRRTVKPEEATEKNLPVAEKAE